MKLLALITFMICAIFCLLYYCCILSLCNFVLDRCYLDEVSLENETLCLKDTWIKKMLNDKKIKTQEDL